MTTEQIAAKQPSPLGAVQEQSDLTEIRSRVTDIEQHARTFIRQRPVVAVLAAVGVGYLVARLVSRVSK